MIEEKDDSIPIIKIGPLIADACEHYGWTPSDCLSMPASQFFSMHKEIARHKAIHYSRMADIAAIPMCKPEYYRSLKEDLKADILGWDSPPRMPEMPKPVVEEDHVKNSFTGLFAQKRRLDGVRTN